MLGSLQVKIEAQYDGSHQQPEQQHEVEQNGGVGAPEHPLLWYTAPQHSKLGAPQTERHARRLVTEYGCKEMQYPTTI